MRIVIIHPAFLGDALFLGPAIRAIKSHDKNHEVIVCTSTRGESITRLLPGCNSVFLFDKRAQDKGLAGLYRASKRLKTLNIDAAIVSHYSVRSGLLAKLAGIPIRIGYALFCNQRLKLNRSQPFVMRSIRLVEDLLKIHMTDQTLQLNAPANTEEYAHSMQLKFNMKTVGIVPFSERATKMWNPEKYAFLIQQLAQQNWQIVLFGGVKTQEKEMAARIIEYANTQNLINSVGNRIEQAISLLSFCDIIVGGDTGLVHAGRALGKKTVLLFGPTPLTSHIFKQTDRPINLGLACQPCHRSGSDECPLKHHHCMKLLSVEQVMAAIADIC